MRITPLDPVLPGQRTWDDYGLPADIPRRTVAPARLPDAPGDEQLDGSWAWTSFTMRKLRDVNNRRRGRLLYRKADDGG